MNSKKSASPHELIILFLIGFTPKDIIKLGYTEVTAYNYKKKYEKALFEIKKRLIK